MRSKVAKIIRYAAKDADHKKRGVLAPNEKRANRRMKKRFKEKTAAERNLQITFLRETQGRTVLTRAQLGKARRMLVAGQHVNRHINRSLPRE